MKKLDRYAAMKRLLINRIVLFFALVCFGVALGYYLHGRDVVPYRVVTAVKRALHISSADQNPPGQWNPMDPGHPTEELSRHQKAEIEKLLSLGYAGGSVPRPRNTGVTHFDPSTAGKGLLFFTSGHGPEAALMTRDGVVLHQWRYAYRDIWAANKEAFLKPKKNGTTSCWRRAHLFPNGDILAIYEGHGLVKLDQNSRLMWSYAGKCHHDLHVDEDGRIWVLTREAGIVPRLDASEPVLLDFFTVLSPGGEFERRIPLLEAFETSVYASCLDKAPATGDIFHTNTLERFDGSLAHLSPIFAKGNILTSMREMNVIAIVDPRQTRVVWALSGMWVKQHQPTLLESGHILLFDNLGRHGRSKVIEIDPLTQEIVWAYADGPGRSLYSKTCGSNQRLVNGNTLIIESDNGRALEVTPNLMIVWEYRNPHRAGKNNELIAAILDMVVLPEDFPLEWLPGKEDTGI